MKVAKKVRNFLLFLLVPAMRILFSKCNPAIIFVGPPRTGSTSTQTFFHEHSHFLFENGVYWPSPNFYKEPHPKSFAYLYSLLAETDYHAPRHYVTAPEDRPLMHTWYKNESQFACDQNLTMVIHSEALAWALIPEVTETFMTNLKSLAAPGQEYQIVVTFRQPRFQHFFSTFKRYHDNQKSFKNWTCKQFGTEKDRNVVYGTLSERPFQLAETFLSYGFPVILVDFWGAKENHSTMQNLIQTEILKIPEEKVQMKEYHSNARTYKNDITNAKEIELIEKILILNDCVENSFTFYNQLRILGQHSKYTISECGSNLSEIFLKMYLKNYCQ